MLRPTAKTVVPMKDYMLRISFDNGERKDFDVKPYIRGSWYGELSDPAYFKSVFARLCLREIRDIMTLSQQRGCRHGEITASA